MVPNNDSNQATFYLLSSFHSEIFFISIINKINFQKIEQ